MSPKTPERRPVSPFSTEEVLHGVRAGLVPSAKTKAAVRRQMLSRIEAPAYLQELQKDLNPSSPVSRKVWSQISSRIAPVSQDIWNHVRDSLAAPSGVQLTVLERIVQRISLARRSPFRPIKWVAAFAVLALAATSSPVFFLAPPTIAESRVLVMGEMYVLSGGLWQPKPEAQNELNLTRSALLQTGDSTNEVPAKVVDHDDGVFRLAPNTTIALHDLRDSPAKITYPVTLTLHKGRIWVQGFIPDGITGISVAVGDATVLINEGSVSITSDGRVQVWNQHATIRHHGQDITLLAGEEYIVSADGIAKPRKMADHEYEDVWVTKNLAFDAVHQREIVQLQQERRASQAGMLPTNILYSVKRLAEAVNVAFSFSTEEKTRKLLAQANKRLNEAAALTAGGDSGAAAASLADYRQTVLAAATGSDIAQLLVQQELVTTTSDIGAALPGDDAYALKNAVLETTAAANPASESEVRQELLADQVLAVKRTMEEGNIQTARAALAHIQPQIDDLQNASSIVQEATASLSVSSVAFNPVTPSETPALADLLPARPTTARPPLPQDRDAMVGLKLGELNNLSMEPSICSQAVTILKDLEPYADREYVIGRILREAKGTQLTQFRRAYEYYKTGEKLVCNEGKE
ncbi:MAG: hypothetical protein JWM56_999 [Candidatus Peribacteria bacterium]|nr:hypothetical protein [Candidatus Peribacteria bacterium]